jgi:hypothetical protein
VTYTLCPILPDRRLVRTNLRSHMRSQKVFESTISTTQYLGVLVGRLPLDFFISCLSSSFATRPMNHSILPSRLLVDFLTYRAMQGLAALSTTRTPQAQSPLIYTSGTGMSPCTSDPSATLPASACIPGCNHSAPPTAPASALPTGRTPRSSTQR